MTDNAVGGVGVMVDNVVGVSVMVESGVGGKVISS